MKVRVKYQGHKRQPRGEAAMIVGECALDMGVDREAWPWVDCPDGRQRQFHVTRFNAGGGRWTEPYVLINEPWEAKQLPGFKRNEHYHKHFAKRGGGIRRRHTGFVRR